MKKFLTGVFNIAIVLIPLCLLACGLHLATGSVWDVLMIAGILFVGGVAVKKYLAVRDGKEQLGQAQAIVAMTGIFTSFLLLALQLLFCGPGVNMIPCEAAMTWMFLVGTIAGIYQLHREKPLLKSVAASMYFGYTFTALCAFGGMFDMFEYFTGLQVPERVGNILGIIVPICVIGCILFFIIGLVQDRVARR